MGIQNDTRVLQNEQLQVEVVPGQGGRIVSILNRQAGIEFLTLPSTSARRSHKPGKWDRFEESPCAGVDECLPSIGACGLETPGGSIPDHGDFWRLAWDVTAFGRRSISMQATGFSRPLRFEKRLNLHASSLEIQYRIHNLQSAALPFLYALHPLFAVDPGDRIVLPAEVTSVRLESSNLSRLGAAGSFIEWPRPHASPTVDLSIAESISASRAEMFYTPRLKSGWCGLYRVQSGRGIVLRFDTQRLPFVGLWLCYGGWPDEASLPRQYAIGLEPTVSPWGTLNKALENAQAPVLGGNQSFEFGIVFDNVGREAQTYGAFVAACL